MKDDFVEVAIAQQLDNIVALGAFDPFDFDGGVLGEAAPKPRAGRIIYVDNIAAAELASDAGDARGEQAARLCVKGARGAHLRKRE